MRPAVDLELLAVALVRLGDAIQTLGKVQIELQPAFHHVNVKMGTEVLLGIHQ